MDRLLITADDFTGALDTGVQFAAAGADTRVVTGADPDALAQEDAQVLVVDTRSRHLPARQAHDAVFDTVRAALAAGFTHVYKKTDSALRGNVGAELAAVLDAAGGEGLAFFPAFPKMGRVTRDGVHYVDGVPVAESVFGRDPFEPVRASRLAEVIGAQTDRPVTVHPAGDGAAWTEGGIHVYDGAADEDLRRGALALQRTGRLRLLAGCAGFASQLPAVLDMPLSPRRPPALTGKLLTVCGSVNPITVRQLDAAERAGAVRIRLTPEQKLTPDWARTPEGERAAEQWLAQIGSASNAVLECGVTDRAATDEFAARMGLGPDETRRRIADAMGGVLRRLLELGLERDLLVTGGDTLLAFMGQIGCRQLRPLGEPAPGVALSRLSYGGRQYNLLSKSGGFGQPELLCRLVRGS